ncbi:MAG: hypothetical protein ABIP08_02440 [Lautropia sp.]
MDEAVKEDPMRDRRGRYVAGHHGGPGRKRRDRSAFVREIYSSLEPHLRASVEMTICGLIDSGAIPISRAARVLRELGEMPLFLDVGHPRRPVQLFNPAEADGPCGLPPGDAVRRCRAAIKELGLKGNDAYEQLAASDHEDAWIAREILATIAAGKKRRERGNDGG